MMDSKRAFCIALVAGILPLRANVARATDIDYAREARWAAEVTPSIVVGDAIELQVRGRKVLALFTEPSGPAKAGVVLVHGLGVHPDYGVVGSLRTLLADAGFATLSVQMPVLAADAPRDDYALAFPEAGDRIAAALAMLRDKGYARVAIVSHSMGASMADAYLARRDAVPIGAWVPIGMPVAFSRRPREPVLDVLAQTELAPVIEQAPGRRKALEEGCSRQVTIAGADHYFDGETKALAAAIASFLARVAAGTC